MRLSKVERRRRIRTSLKRPLKQGSDSYQPTSIGLYGSLPERSIGSRSGTGLHTATAKVPDIGASAAAFQGMVIALTEI